MGIRGLEVEEKKLKFCRQALASFTQLQNVSFHVVDLTRTAAKCTVIINARAKRAKLLFFIVKFPNL